MTTGWPGSTTAYAFVVDLPCQLVLAVLAHPLNYLVVCPLEAQEATDRAEFSTEGAPN